MIFCFYPVDILLGPDDARSVHLRSTPFDSHYLAPSISTKSAQSTQSMSGCSGSMPSFLGPMHRTTFTFSLSAHCPLSFPSPHRVGSGLLDIRCCCGSVGREPMALSRHSTLIRILPFFLLVLLLLSCFSPFFTTPNPKQNAEGLGVIF